jgi:hypothetical protein
MNDVVVNKQPKFLTEMLTDSTHAMVLPANDEKARPPLTIPLDIRDLISCFPMRKPTVEEYESSPCNELISEDPAFDPHDPSFARQDAACTIIEASCTQQRTMVCAVERLDAYMVFDFRIVVTTVSCMGMTMWHCTTRQHCNYTSGAQ